MADLLLEIGTEEIPARFMLPAIAALAEKASALLAERHLRCGAVAATGTPRRLVLTVRDVAAHQELVTREISGPPKKVAFDPDGNPTAAAVSFARGQGVAVEALEVRQTPKGEYLYAVRQEGGAPALELLSEILPGLLASISFPKSMRWGDGSVRFARPIHWILAMLGGEVVPFEFAGLRSGNLSRGHRHMAKGLFTINDLDGYFRKTKMAMVIVDHHTRRQMIHEVLAKEAEAHGGRVMEDAELLDTVTFLVEWPVITCGQFKEEFLQLPPEVLVTSMRAHQKYFPVVDLSGRLKPLFLTVNNVKAEEMDVIRRGNERVLAARLADARFFYREDCKAPLAVTAEKLRSVVYQEKLGTSWEKMERFRALAGWLSRSCALGDRAVVERAALLAKADLVTEMVGEFPELQGTMGYYYALESKETPEVAEAVRDHYLPRFAGDALPASPAAAAVGLADRMDTIAGSFGIGQKPTGSEDPYGLRRLTLAVINIIQGGDFDVDLTTFVAEAVRLLEGKLDRPAADVTAEVLEFFRGRLLAQAVAEGMRPDLVEAVLAAGMAHLPDARRRLLALSEFSRQPEFEPLAVTFRRVVNIIPAGFQGKVHQKQFVEEAERTLHRVYTEKKQQIKEAAAAGRYDEVLASLASLRPAVDAFFAEIMVMAEDEGVRNNRLALMKSLADLFSLVADFGRMAV
jgi:glycyl-tRNA synthetase beta chain